MSKTTQQLQYVPFNSSLETGFWHKLSQLKLDVYGLDDKLRSLRGFYHNCDAAGLPCRLFLDYSAFELSQQTQPHNFPANGILKLTNTIEEFKQCDKKKLIEDVAEQLWDDIKSDRVLEKPSLLLRILLLTYADLKKYNYYYWFAFPALSLQIDKLEEVTKIQDRFSSQKLQVLSQEYNNKVIAERHGFFFIKETPETLVIHSLKDIKELAKQEKVLLGFCDPSTLPSHPGWPLRNFLALTAYHWGQHKQQVEVLCLREQSKDGTNNFDSSFILKVSLPTLTPSCPPCVGWEKNERQKFGPRHVNLSSSMDPARLAESAVDLNLKLMRWRLLPELDLEKVSKTKCLLLGAGTLGCNVARCLLGWGVRKITLVDNGKVSYSNPVRQSLFGFSDSLNGGQNKAEAAAKSLQDIFPGVDATGLSLSIPMPGHAIAGAVEEQTSADVRQLEELVDSHDVLFLLMDTRESRWLPTMIGAAKHKLVMNAALGFDTYLVIRHGLKQNSGVAMATNEASPDFKANIPGSQLGCYFCNDVVAPGNSTRDRTLDQQCTVSRPGMSMLASALVVELMVSVIQHPDGGYAAADVPQGDSMFAEDVSSPLGLVPHQLRGFLSRFHQVAPACKAFHQCTACSKLILDKYKEEGFSFLLNVFNDPSFLERLTGLSELQDDSIMAEIWELSDEEDIGN